MQKSPDNSTPIALAPKALETSSQKIIDISVDKVEERSKLVAERAIRWTRSLTASSA
jgi:hypothetical protein